jgi:hypothetical protein
VPSDISDLALWLDAADASTLTLDGSNNVEQWNDKSGNGRHVEQSNATLRPARTLSSINGLTALTFDGTDDRLIGTFASISQPITVFCVVRVDNLGSQRTIFDSRLTVIFAHYTTPPTNYNYHGGVARSFAGVVAGSTYLGAITYNGASSSLRINRSLVDSGNAGSSSLTDGISVGCTRASSAFHLGAIAELVFYSKVLSAGEITSVENYLAAKWGTP